MNVIEAGAQTSLKDRYSSGKSFAMWTVRRDRKRLHFMCIDQEFYSNRAMLEAISMTFQFSSVARSYLTLCDPMDCSMPGLPVHCQLPEFTQTHVHWVGDAIQPSHPLSPLFPPAFNLSQHHGLFPWVSSSHQVAKVLEFQLQHQFFQWIFRTDFL